MSFKKAERRRRKARIALDGPSGSGKTYSALRAAFAFGGKVAVIDTEHGSASLYAGEAPDGTPWEFDTLELTNFSPDRYQRAIEEAAQGGYDVLVIDSLSHAWMGEGGALDLVDRAKTANKFAAWKDVTPLHRRMVDAILAAPLHVIATMRTKTEYVLESDERGRQVPRKVGLAPIQRDGCEYEFDVVADLNLEHIATVGKSRCSALQDARGVKPGPDFWRPMIQWLDSAAETPRANAVQIGMWDDHLHRKGITAEVAGRRLSELFGTPRFNDLTPEQADEVLAKLGAA